MNIITNQLPWQQQTDMKWTIFLLHGCLYAQIYVLNNIFRLQLGVRIQVWSSVMSHLASLGEER